jgi:TDG/mug DNA glycosylase family protein
MARPTSDELVNADGSTIPDLIAPGLRLLLVGINPGRHSGATGFHFGNPANRLWPALHQSRLTPRQLHPSDAKELLALGIGITNLVEMTTQGAKDLKPGDYRAGVDNLRLKVIEFRPRTVAILGKSAFESGFDRPRSTLGRQADKLEGSELWLLPNPSPRNTWYPLPDFVLRFRDLRAAIDADG